MKDNLKDALKFLESAADELAGATLAACEEYSARVESSLENMRMSEKRMSLQVARLQEDLGRSGAKIANAAREVHELAVNLKNGEI
jgi:chromosome segregation ATPase